MLNFFQILLPEVEISPVNLNSTALFTISTYFENIRVYLKPARTSQSS